MSYEIVYAKQFIKTEDGRIIPLALHGSNNCYEVKLDSRAGNMKEGKKLECFVLTVAI